MNVEPKLFINGELIKDGTWKHWSEHDPVEHRAVWHVTIDEDPAELAAEAKQREEAEALAEAERGEAGNATFAGMPLHRLSRLELIQAMKFVLNNPWLFTAADPSMSAFGNSNYQIKRKKEDEQG